VVVFSHANGALQVVGPFEFTHLADVIEAWIEVKGARAHLHGVGKHRKQSLHVRSRQGLGAGLVFLEVRCDEIITKRPTLCRYGVASGFVVRDNASLQNIFDAQ